MWAGVCAALEARRQCSRTRWSSLPPTMELIRRGIYDKRHCNLRVRPAHHGRPRHRPELPASAGVSIASWSVASVSIHLSSPGAKTSWRQTARRLGLLDIANDRGHRAAAIYSELGTMLMVRDANWKLVYDARARWRAVPFQPASRPDGARQPNRRGRVRTRRKRYVEHRFAVANPCLAITPRRRNAARLQRVRTQEKGRTCRVTAVTGFPASMTRTAAISSLVAPDGGAAVVAHFNGICGLLSSWPSGSATILIQARRQPPRARAKHVQRCLAKLTDVGKEGLFKRYSRAASETVCKSCLFQRRKVERAFGLIMSLIVLSMIAGCASPTPRSSKNPVTVVVEEVRSRSEVLATVVVEEEVPVEEVVQQTVIVEKGKRPSLRPWSWKEKGRRGRYARRSR